MNGRVFVFSSAPESWFARNQPALFASKSKRFRDNQHRPTSVLFAFNLELVA